MNVQSSHPPVFLAGDKIDLCPVRSEDAPLYARWINDEETANFLLWHKTITRHLTPEFLS